MKRVLLVIILKANAGNFVTTTGKSDELLTSELLKETMYDQICMTAEETHSVDRTRAHRHTHTHTHAHTHTHTHVNAAEELEL